MEASKPVVLFDGDCNYCTWIILFLIRHDKKDFFRFSATGVPAGKELVKKYQLEKIKNQTVILILDGEILTETDAIFTIYKNLSGIFPLLYPLIFLPRFIRDGVYGIISRNRYKWFGKRKTCFVPDEKLKFKFL
jgi:predicted DCC family thiol-disulfide oxidoreductase YuxK